MSIASLPWRFQPSTGAAFRPLTPLVALYSHPFYGAPIDRQNHFHHPRVNKNGFLDPRRLLSTSAPLNACADRSPPPFPPLCHGGSASDAFCRPSPLLAHCRGARPPAVFPGYSPVNCEDQTPLVNFCNRNELRAPLHDRPNPALTAGDDYSFQSFADRGFTDQEPA